MFPCHVLILPCLCHGPAGVPGLATRCSCVCEHMACCVCVVPRAFTCLLSVPSHLVTKSLFQWLHLCIPRLSPYIASWCLQSCTDPVLLESVMFDCAPVFCLPACFFPLGVVFVHFCFIFIKYLIPLHLSPRPHLSRDRTDQPDEDSAEGATGNHGSRAETSQRPSGRPEH